MTQQPTTPPVQAPQSPKLQLPAGTDESAEIDISNIDFATLVEEDGKSILVITLKNGTTIKVPGTYENVSYLEGCGIFVSTPPGASSSYGAN